MQGLRIDNTHVWVDLHGDVHVAPVLSCDYWQNAHCAFNFWIYLDVKYLGVVVQKGVHRLLTSFSNTVN